mmetsp:Transcript_18953/g.28082  ORF Transcript_18953/g.28082 Transcript_18953/m.28082 type:complete len:401 (-) Transcript_18953:84-1286(-)
MGKRQLTLQRIGVLLVVLLVVSNIAEPTQVDNDKMAKKNGTPGGAGNRLAVCKNMTTGGVEFSNITLPEAEDIITISPTVTRFWPRNNTAFCEVESNAFLAHFVHYMQPVLRCWSFFQLNPGKSWVMAIPDEHISSKTHSALFKDGFNKVLMDVGISIENTSEVRPYLGRGENSSSVLIPRSFHIPFWMGSPGHARALRDQILASLQPDPGVNVGRVCNKSSLPTIAILNRRDSSGRSLLNVGSIVGALEERFRRETGSRQQHINVTYFEGGIPFRDQVMFFAGADIVISPHGAQLAGMPFMPDGGAVLEVYPFGYVIPEYFGSLAASAGVDHAYVYETMGDLEGEKAYWGRTYKLRSEARRKNMCPSVLKMLEGVDELVDRWRSRCSELKHGIANPSQS